MLDPPPDVVARLRAAGCVFAEQEAALLAAEAADAATLAGMVDQRAAGTPPWSRPRNVREALSPGSSESWM